MADQTTPGTGSTPAGGDEHRESTPLEAERIEDVTAVPLWRVRLSLFLKRFGEQWRIYTQNKLGLIGLGMIGIFALMAIAQPIFMATIWDERIYDPVKGRDDIVVERTVVQRSDFSDPHTEVMLEQLLIQPKKYPDPKVGDTVKMVAHPAPPSGDHWLGTDRNGRDVASQLLFGARAAFLLGAVAAITTVFLATVVGAFAAYFGGVTDSVLMRLADLFLLLPLIPVLAVITLWWAPNMVTLGILIGLVSGWGGTAIVMKAQALSVTVKPFIDAARVAGGGHGRIVFRHIVPNIVPLALLNMMFSVTTAIGIEATLSFLGLLDVPMSWGIMIHVASAGGYLLLGLDYWWLLIPAGAAVTLLAAAFYFAGRAMDAVINPRLRQR